MEERRCRQHKRSALAKLRDVFFGGPFLCANFCTTKVQNEHLIVLQKVSMPVILVEYSSTGPTLTVVFPINDQMSFRSYHLTCVVGATFFQTKEGPLNWA